MSGPLKLPKSDDDLQFPFVGILPNALDKSAKTFGADTNPVRTTEALAENQPARVDLPDLDFRTTRYYFTVVPVAIYVDEKGEFTYYDIESPQDACEAGRVV